MWSDIWGAVVMTGQDIEAGAYIVYLWATGQLGG